MNLPSRRPARGTHPLQGGDSMRPTETAPVRPMPVVLAALATMLLVACGGPTQTATPPRPAPLRWASPTAILAPADAKPAVAGVWIQPLQTPTLVVGGEVPTVPIPVAAAASTPVPESDSL